MQVKDALSRFFTVIDHQTEGVADAFLFGNPGRRLQQVAENIAIITACGRQRGNGFFRDDEYMHWRLGIDVPEGQAQIVLVHDVGGNFPGYDLAEYRLCHCCWRRMLPARVLVE